MEEAQDEDDARLSRLFATGFRKLTYTYDGTAVAVAGLYDTPEKIHTCVQAVGSPFLLGGALLAINARVEGIDGLGGVLRIAYAISTGILLSAGRFAVRRDPAGQFTRSPRSPRPPARRAEDETVVPLLCSESAETQCTALPPAAAVIWPTGARTVRREADVALRA